MFSLFRKRQSTEELTFKARVEKFWQWYSQVGARFYQTIESGKCADLAAEVSEGVDDLLPGLAWVFGAGVAGVGHSFTLSGEGVLHRQLLAIYCVSRAPKLNGWTFYASRQPGTIECIGMEIGGHKFDAMEFWITPKIDAESEKVNITVWHPLFATVRKENERLSPLFLFLDEVLGEFGTGQWIGEIESNDTQLADAIPLKELHAFIKKIETEKGWQKLPPGESGVVYSREERLNRFLRDDIIAGSTTHPDLVNEYFRVEGRLQDPLAGTGADYAFVSFDCAFFPDVKEMVDKRSIIEEALDKALVSAQSGRVLGGAFGTHFGYIDLLLFDGRNSLEIVGRVLRKQNLPAGTAINFFAKEKISQRVIL
jgi:hypothetical protein